MSEGDTVEVLRELSKGDKFRVGCHDQTLQVHSADPFVGAIVLDAYDERGAQWPVGEVDGVFWLGYSQLSSPDEQSRAKKIEQVEVTSRGDNA